MSCLRLIALCMLAIFSAVSPAQQAGLNNDAVVKLAKSGIGDDLVVATINAQPGNYSLTTDDMMALKKEGVSDKVIGAMIGKANAPAAPAVAGANPAVAGVDEVGVYYKDRSGHWVAMSPEIVNYKSGGALKSFATNGIVKQDKNGHIDGETGKIAVTKPVDFLLYVTEGTAPEEYLLLKLRPSNGKSREFRSQTGGVIHNSTGATRDNVEFTSTKIATRMYQVTLPVGAPVGEYGILPPGAITSSNAASGGKIYTFKVLE
jgi:hypothetical protein